MHRSVVISEKNSKQLDYLLHLLWNIRILTILWFTLEQPTLVLWGEQDQVFPLELAHRLKR